MPPQNSGSLNSRNFRNHLNNNLWYERNFTSNMQHHAALFAYNNNRKMLVEPPSAIPYMRRPNKRLFKRRTYNFRTRCLQYVPNVAPSDRRIFLNGATVLYTTRTPQGSGSPKFECHRRLTKTLMRSTATTQHVTQSAQPDFMFVYVFNF